MARLSPAPPAAWPATAPAAPEAERILLAALAGMMPAGGPLRAAAEQVVIGLSGLEREVLADRPQPFDAAPVRAGAVMRLRVAAAVAAAPPPGGPVDSPALQAILAELDGLLARVNALLQGVPDAARPGLESIRNALVKEAVELGEVAARAAGASAAAARPAAPRRPAAARMISAGPRRAAPAPRRPPALLVLLVLVAVPVLGYHGWTWRTRHRPAPPAAFEGAPAGTMGSGRGANRVLMAVPGKRVDPAELERFRALEASRGNQLRELAPGTWAIEPAPAPGGARP